MAAATSHMIVSIIPEGVAAHLAPLTRALPVVTVFGLSLR